MDSWIATLCEVASNQFLPVETRAQALSIVTDLLNMVAYETITGQAPTRKARERCPSEKTARKDGHPLENATP